MRYCKTCKEWRGNLRGCSKAGHDIDWDRIKNISKGYKVRCGKKFSFFTDALIHEKLCEKCRRMNM